MKTAVAISMFALGFLVTGCEQDGDLPLDSGTWDTLDPDTVLEDPSPDTAVDPESDTAVIDSLEDPAVDDGPEILPSDEYCNIDDFHRYACCVLDEVNRYRLENGVGLVDYVWDPDIASCAFYYAQYMAAHGTFAHGADGQNFGDRLDSFGVAWASAGENLQRNSEIGWEAACQETVWGWGGWAHSTDGHREAMLGQDPSGTDKMWTHAAAGVDRSGTRWYVAMYFVRY